MQTSLELPQVITRQHLLLVLLVCHVPDYHFDSRVGVIACRCGQVKHIGMKAWDVLFFANAHAALAWTSDADRANVIHKYAGRDSALPVNITSCRPLITSRHGALRTGTLQLPHACKFELALSRTE